MTSEARADAGAKAWQALAAGGHVLLMRHAQTDSGVGDPPGFRLDDCSSQRNLNASGRAQAEDLGRQARLRNIRFQTVASSVWCRCQDTARLAFGEFMVWPALNSFFDDRATAAAQTAEVLRALSRFSATVTRADATASSPAGNLALITHQVNITALTGQSAAMGDCLILRVNGEKLDLVGRISG